MTRDFIFKLGLHFPVGVLALCPDSLRKRLWRWWRHLVPGLLLLTAIGSRVGSHLAVWLSLHNFVIAKYKITCDRARPCWTAGKENLYGCHTCNDWVLISRTTGVKYLLYYWMFHPPFPLLIHTLWCCVHHLYCLFHIQSYWHYWEVPSMKRASY